MKEIRTEVMTEILEGVGISATPEQIKVLTEDFVLHMEMEREMEFNSRGGIGGGHKRECSKCDALKRQIEDLEEEVSIYHDSVKERRNADMVWTDRHTRQVMYR